MQQNIPLNFKTINSNLFVREYISEMENLLYVPVYKNSGGFLAERSRLRHEIWSCRRLSVICCGKVIFGNDKYSCIVLDHQSTASSGKNVTNVNTVKHKQIKAWHDT